MRGTTFRRAAALAAFALALIAMAACGGAARPAPTATAPAAPPAITAAADEPLIIGVSVAMSGDQAATGGDIADAVNLAVADAGGALRGHPIKVIVSDDGCTDAEKARSIAREFATDAALLGVIGPMCTTGAQAANSVYEAAGIVHISPSATRVDLSEQGEQYFFRVGWRDDAQASWQARFAWNTLRIESVALVDDAEPYGRGLADAFAKAFEGLGGRIVARERVERGTTDMTDLARKVSSAAPGAVVFEGLNPEGALVAKALRTEQFTGVFIGPDGLLNARDFLGAGGAAVEGAIVSGGPTPDDAFVARFQAATQRAPSTPFVLQAYDAATILMRAADATASAPGGSVTIDRAALAERLRSQTFTGLTGRIQFDEQGDRTGDSAGDAGIVIYRVTDGRFVPVP